MQLPKANSVLAAASSLLLLLPIAAADGFFNDITSIPTSTPAEEYLSRLSGLPTDAVTGAQATSLASALFSAERDFVGDAGFPTMYSRMWSAAARATDAPEVVASMAVEGWDWNRQRSAEWWTDNMPDGDDALVSGYVEKVQEVYRDVVATATPTASEGGASRCTGLGVAGVVAGVVAAGVMAVV